MLGKRRVLSWALAAVIVAVAALAPRAAAQITGCGEPYACDPAPALNDTQVLADERAACAADTVCAALFGQADGPNQAYFDMLRATVAGDVPISPDYALRQIICGNAWNDSSVLATAQLLVAQYGLNNPCGGGEVMLSPGVCAPRSDQFNTHGEWQYQLLIGLLFSVVVLIIIIIIGIIVWSMRGRPVIPDKKSL